MQHALSQLEAKITDPLHELLHQGARALIAKAAEAELESFLAAYAEPAWMMAAGAWCATATCLSARSTPVWAR